ncbi:hypothetical protein BDV41DRAFT_39428 [Aspergillus transmontanensis]|uniref:Uncharacterized protein n=1 Tax=Aspergillus transmontanensis TaxID=1034304 RepID=A0A5N6W915_9EURO|nr:hypothetical protein BDV41DRAFT_39428 [Aspergillus transmontanensis]
MSDSLWDPDLILQVTKGRRQDMFCLGRTRSRDNSRCGWDIRRHKYSRIRTMLKDISKRLPHTITNDELSTMASLGLCGYHAEQEAEIVDGWLKILTNIEHLNSEYQYSLQTNEETLEAMAIDMQKCRELIHCSPNSDDNLSVALARYVRRQARLKKDLEECRTTLASMQKTTANIEGLEKKESEENMRIDELREEVNTLRGGNIAKHLQMKRLHSQKDDLEQRLKDTTNELNSVCVTSQRLRREREGLQSELETAKDEITVLKESKSALLTQSNTISTTLGETRQQLTASCQANEHLSRELETAKVKLAKLHDLLRVIDMAKKASILYKLRSWAQVFWCRITGWFRSRRVEISDEEEGLTLAPVDGSHTHGG